MGAPEQLLGQGRGREVKPASIGSNVSKGKEWIWLASECRGQAVGIQEEGVLGPSNAYPQGVWCLLELGAGSSVARRILPCKTGSPDDAVTQEGACVATFSPRCLSRQGKTTVGVLGLWPLQTTCPYSH
jgi:hypothetical protein